MELLKYANGNLPQSEEERQKMIDDAAKHYAEFMTALKFDFKSDPNSADTPRRVAKAFINDVIKFSGIFFLPLQEIFFRGFYGSVS